MILSLRSIVISIALLVVLVVVVAGASYLITSKQHKTYVASGVVRFEAEHPELRLVGLQVGNAPDDRTETTDALVAASSAVESTAGKSLGLSATAITSHMAIESTTGANAVVIQASGSTPEQALRYANGYISALITTRREVVRSRAQAVITQIRRQLRRLEAKKPSVAFSFDVGMHNELALESALARVGFDVPEVLKSPQLPTSPATPHTQRNTLFGALFGLVLGMGLISLFLRARRPPEAQPIPAVIPTAPVAPPPVEEPAGTAPDTDDDWYRRPQ